MNKPFQELQFGFEASSNCKFRHMKYMVLASGHCSTNEGIINYLLRNNGIWSAQEFG